MPRPKKRRETKKKTEIKKREAGFLAKEEKKKNQTGSQVYRLFYRNMTTLYCHILISKKKTE